MSGLSREQLEQDIDFIAALGVQFRTNTAIGRDVTVDRLRQEGYKAFFIASEFLSKPGIFGLILAALSDSGRADDTLVFFTSDNGGASFATTNRPLRGAKGAFFEGGIRVPSVIEWPAVVKAPFALSPVICG